MNIGRLFLLGDSYTTFQGAVPEGYAVWYSTEYPESRIHETDLNRLEQTWWHQFICETQAELVLNCSYSGTTICNTGYDGRNCSDNSFVARMDRLIEAGYFEENKVDTIILFGGTNDSWAGSPVGNLMYENWESQALSSVLPAFSYLLHRIRENIPKARTICLINTDLKQEISDGMKMACGRFGVEAVELKNISKTSGHPNIQGMKEIKIQLMEYLTGS